MWVGNDVNKLIVVFVSLPCTKDIQPTKNKIHHILTTKPGTGQSHRLEKPY